MTDGEMGRERDKEGEIRRDGEGDKDGDIK